MVAYYKNTLERMPLGIFPDWLSSLSKEELKDFLEKLRKIKKGNDQPVGIFQPIIFLKHKGLDILYMPGLCDCGTPSRLRSGF